MCGVVVCVCVGETLTESLRRNQFGQGMVLVMIIHIAIIILDRMFYRQARAVKSMASMGRCVLACVGGQAVLQRDRLIPSP